MKNDSRAIVGFLVVIPLVLAAGGCQPVDPTPNAAEAALPPFPTDLLASPHRHEFGVTIHPDGREIFFGVDTGDRSEIWVTRHIAGTWSEPAPFLHSPRHRHFDPYLAVDGSELYFLTDRPRRPSDSDPREDADIWRMSRHSDGGWSEPTPLPPPINSDSDEFYVSIDGRGRLAFSSNRNTDQPGERDYGLYLTQGPPSAEVVVERLGVEFSTGAYEGDPLIAPDGSYVVFASYRRSGYGGSDLYLSVRGDGGWSEIVNLGVDVNSEADELCPALDPTGKWFLFTSRGDIRRVPMDTLDAARRRAAAGEPDSPTP